VPGAASPSDPGPKEALGGLEAQFFAYTQMRGMRTVRVGDLTGSLLDVTADQERRLLSRLAKAGLIARVRRGLYLVPPRLPLGGAWTPGEILALNTLIEDRGGAYQISGPNAFQRYGWDEQVPNRLFAYNDRLSGTRVIGAVRLSLTKVATERLGDVERERTPDGEVAVYSSRARALLDAVYDWSRFATLPRAYGWIRAELVAGRVVPGDLVRVALRYGDVGTMRRVGALLEREGVDARRLVRLRREIGPRKNPLAMVPGRPTRGEIDRSWGVVWNEGSLGKAPA
jgi:predicted transcriptional regulator of viral defense system